MRLLGIAIRDAEQRDSVKKQLLSVLWRGEVTAARAYLQQLIVDWEDGISTIAISDVGKLIKLREYLLTRAEHIPDYLQRVKNGEWIANTQAEKYNDWPVAIRCKKKNGMRWSRAGVSAIAALEAARRNGELEEWRASEKLPSWDKIGGCAA